MTPLRARVENGRIRLDEPTDLPDGTELELVIDDRGDLTAEDRSVLHDALVVGWQEVEAGDVQPASEGLDELRRRR